MSDWWADVAGQVFAGIVVVVAVAVVTALTPWGRRIGKAMLRSARSVMGALATLRVTTQRRIDAQISSAVAHAVVSIQEGEEDDGEGRPLRPEDYDGWVMEPAPEPKTWLLRNQTRETAMVVNIWPATNYFPFDWEPPNFPITLAPRESVSFPAVKLRSGFSLMPFMESPMANVHWEDTHGDQHEDIIWVVT
ncbi:hypothetical protein [Microbacterium xanthum]|uniref:hypothetical protein n=1 Tax=Microbacterium xanthum TaxID=3079794 RepID=UPI002AD50BA6|nr:hypothetical protein [Microbacterium sp. KSW-48]MDZ8173110.1 hypothetical protein [Microbacterium sp. KSW-48]